jgi:hypothetical protein
MVTFALYGNKSIKLEFGVVQKVGLMYFKAIVIVLNYQRKTGQIMYKTNRNLRIII